MNTAACSLAISFGSVMVIPFFPFKYCLGGQMFLPDSFLTGCRQGADQFGIDLCRGHGFLYFETNGRGWGSGHASSSIWPGGI